MFMYMFHIGPAILTTLACCFVFWRWKTHGFWVYFLLGWTLEILLSLPAGIWQSVKGWPHINVSSSALWSILLIPLLGWPFNAGGYTIRCVFEATVEPLEWLVGHRSATVFSNMSYYAFLLFIQGGILAALFAWRYKKQRTYKKTVFYMYGRTVFGKFAFECQMVLGRYIKLMKVCYGKQ